jgi:hypothetical protein
MHFSCLDAVHLDGSGTQLPNTLFMTIKPAHKIAYNYCMANIKQSVAVDQVNTALRALGSDNYLFSVCEPLESAYTTLVADLLGPELWDWLTWWMYETDNGSRKMEFYIDGVEYNPQDMTLYRFLEIVDAS